MPPHRNTPPHSLLVKNTTGSTGLQFALLFPTFLLYRQLGYFLLVKMLVKIEVIQQVIFADSPAKIHESPLGHAAISFASFLAQQKKKF